MSARWQPWRWGWWGRLVRGDALAACLRDPDPVVNQMAEHALWTLWFRAGRADAHQRVLEGTRYMNARQLESAEECFSAAIEFDPRLMPRPIPAQPGTLPDGELPPERGGRPKNRCSLCNALWRPGPAWATVMLTWDGRRRRWNAIAGLQINPYLTCIQQIVDELESAATLPGEF